MRDGGREGGRNGGMDGGRNGGTNREEWNGSHSFTSVF